jgi:hypothetical protein
MQVCNVVEGRGYRDQWNIFFQQKLWCTALAGSANGKNDSNDEIWAGAVVNDASNMWVTVLRILVQLVVDLRPTSVLTDRS